MSAVLRRRDSRPPVVSLPPPCDTGREVRLVQTRVVLVVISTAFLAAMAGGLAVALAIADRAPAPQTLSRIASDGPLVSLLLVLAFAGSTLLTAHLARKIARPAVDLDRARLHLGTLYESARSDALQDSLTGLGNHRAFQEEFDRQIEIARRGSGDGLALLLIDLDDFKTINDSAGHSVGDEVLGEFASVLRGGVRAHDRLFRIGGDEFAVLLPGATADAAVQAGRRLLAACLEPRPSSGFGRGFSFSAGVSAAPANGMDRGTLHALADDALYAVKRAGRTDVRACNPGDRRRLADEASLSHASAAVAEMVAGGAVTPVYQPIVDVRTGAVTGFEALVRPSPHGAFDNPGALFAAAEAAGRTTDLDRLCLATVFAGAASLGLDQTLSVNLSPATILDPAFSPNWVVETMAGSDLTPSRVVLEITERQGVEDIDLLRRRLSACTAAGFRLAIDDVGAGNAGLRLLSQNHFDIVKIDLSLVQAGIRPGASQDVLASLVDLARRWGARVVAEGIETPAQLRIVTDLGFGHAQGYLLGRPGLAPALRTVPIEDLRHDVDLATLLSVGPSPFARVRQAA